MHAHKTSRLGLAGLLLLFIAVVAVPASAQDVAPGEGAPIVWPNFGGDPQNLNPLLISDQPSQDIANLIFPAFIAINPQTGSIDPGTPGTLATDWTISEDGRTYTFTLRDDWTWTDGTPITSADVKYAYDAIVSGELDTPLAGFLSSIESVTAPDPQTLEITFTEPDCTALSVARVIPPVPAHVFTEQFGTDYAAINAADWNLNPTTTAGIFDFSNYRPAEQITLVANQEYPDAPGGVIPMGWIQRQLPDQTTVVDQFLAGDLTIVDSVPEDREAELRALADAGEVQFYEALSSGWMYMVFNTADPANPQSGTDEEGNLIDQGSHPIFGDARVRQAVALATDYDALNQGAFNASGIPVASPLLTTSWAYNEELEPYPYDLEAAIALLEEVGWVDDDNDPSTPRVAQGVEGVADGTPLQFSITSFGGNTSVDSALVLLQDQLGRAGFDVQLDILEFQTYLEQVDSQTFDAAVGFLGGFDASNPDELKVLFSASGDVVGSGFNAASYNNPEVTALFEEARTLPGCDLEARRAIYEQIQEILMEDLPFFYLNTSMVPVVVQPDVQNFDPLPLDLDWNIYAWTQTLE